MSRASEVMNSLELAAKKLGMSIEEAVDVLLGTHLTHTVVQKNAADEPKAVEGNDAPAKEAEPGTGTADGAAAGAENPSGEKEPGAGTEEPKAA